MTQQNSTDALKPCPLCASKDVEVRATITDVQVCCNNCGARTGLVYLGADDIANALQTKLAITAWNNRPNSDADALRELQRLGQEADAALAPPEGLAGLEWHKPAHRAVMASVKLGKWMSAALEDPSVCDEMKADIREWFSAGEPMEILGQALAARDDVLEDWQPIETAPRDGTLFLAWSPGRRGALNENAREPYMRLDRWVDRYRNFARQLPEAPYTHWMPAPNPPALKGVPQP